MALTRLAAFGLVAAILAAQTPQKTISGTVTDFKVASLEIGVKPDKGQPVLFTVGPDTEVVQIPPGERDLSNSKQARVTDIARGDRILVSFAAGLADARRIVWISATDIDARNAEERLDWQKRGIAGIVAGKEGDQITIETKTPKGTETTTVVVTGKTIIRRYAPDSVSFADAQLSRVAEISKGDQLRSRGATSEDGKSVMAEDIVFGTFLTKIGTITAVNAEQKEIRIQDLATQKPLTVKLSPNSQLKMLPDMRTMFASMMGANRHNAPAPEPGGPFDVARIIAQLPDGKIDDLKVGGTVIVTSTSGSKNDEVTAILLMGNAETLIQVGRMSGGAEGGQNMSPMDAISRLHGGMLMGSSGLSIPAILP